MTKSFIALLALFAVILACPGEPNCMECAYDEKSKEGTCKQCFNGYFDPKKKLCSSKIQAPVHHCAFYELRKQDGLEFPQCQTCEFNFFLEGGSCKRCESDKCAVCDSRGYCLACFDNKVPDFAKKAECSEKQCSIRNCEVCHFEHHESTDQPTCLKCKAGSVMIKGNNQECLVSKVKNCQTISLVDSEKCEVCAQGFFLDKDFNCVANPSVETSNMWIIYVIALFVLAALGALLYERYYASKQKSETLIEA